MTNEELRRRRAEYDAAKDRGWAYGAEMVAVIDAALDAGAERDEARRQLAEAQRETTRLRAMLDEERETLVTHARAAAMEEAARRIDAAGFLDVQPGPDGMGIERPAGDLIRALAPLSVDCVVVEKSALEKVTKELSEAIGDGHNLKAFAGTMVCRSEPGVDFSDEARRVVEHAESWHKRIVAALTSLQGVK